MADLKLLKNTTLHFAEAAAPSTPDAGEVVLYAKTDGKLYQKDDAGTETDLAQSGAGSTTFVGAKAYSAATQALTTATVTAVALELEEYDSDAFHDLATNNSRLTVPTGKAGKYALKGKVRFAANATGERTIWFRLNGTTTIRGSTVTEGPASIQAQLVTACDVSLSVADYVELIAYQTSGGNLNIGDASTVDWQSTFSIALLGA